LGLLFNGKLINKGLIYSYIWSVDVEVETVLVSGHAKESREINLNAVLPNRGQSINYSGGWALWYRTLCKYMTAIKLINKEMMNY
jgi:hypothetical protein